MLRLAAATRLPAAGYARSTLYVLTRQHHVEAQLEDYNDVLAQFRVQVAVEYKFLKTLLNLSRPRI